MSKKMKIDELKPNQSRINLEVEVVDVGEVKSFLRFGRAIRVANATIKDDTGETKLTLWNGEIDKVKVGSKVRITNGYAKEFQGELTVTAGKFGKLEIMGEGEETEAPAEEPAETEGEEPIETQEEPAEGEVEELESEEVEEPVSEEEKQE